MLNPRAFWRVVRSRVSSRPQAAWARVRQAADAAARGGGLRREHGRPRAGDLDRNQAVRRVRDRRQPAPRGASSQRDRRGRGTVSCDFVCCGTFPGGRSICMRACMRKHAGTQRVAQTSAHARRQAASSLAHTGARIGTMVIMRCMACVCMQALRCMQRRLRETVAGLRWCTSTSHLPSSLSGAAKEPRRRSAARGQTGQTILTVAILCVENRSATSIRASSVEHQDARTSQATGH